MANLSVDSNIVDAAVVGAGTGGLSAALMLARARRAVVVFDNGEPPRNAPAAESHSFFTRDGFSPLGLQRIGFEQLQAYPTVRVVRQAVVDIQKVQPTPEVGSKTLFQVRTASGAGSVLARKLVLATGIRDILPPFIPAHLWAKSVAHCPFCLEEPPFHDKPHVAIVANEADLRHFGCALPCWSNDVSIALDGYVLQPEQREEFAKAGIKFYNSPVVSVQHSNNQVTGVTLADGTVLPAAILFIKPPIVQRSKLAESLGCHLYTPEDAPTPALIGRVATSVTSAADGVPGVWVVGDATALREQVAFAAFSGLMSGVNAVSELVREGACAAMADMAKQAAGATPELAAQQQGTSAQ